MSKELDEKFVSDDGISTAAEPVTPAGGAIAKKKADVKKSVDPKAAKVDAGTPGQGAVKEEAELEEIIEIDESIEAIFEGMDLSEEFKNKVTLVLSLIHI